LLFCLGMDDPGTSALLQSLISANPYPNLDPGPSHSPEPEPQRTEPLALTESEPAAPERYISSQDQSSPLQPLSVAQQSATAGEDDKPPRLYPLFYRHFRGVGMRGGGRRDRRRSSRLGLQTTPTRQRYPRSVPSNSTINQAARSSLR
jgi:hypothetical protein